MRTIVYAGHTPEVSVPAHQLAEIKAGVPFEVPDHVADDLTASGTSTVWLHVVKDQPVTPPPPPAPDTAPDGVTAPAGADTTPED